MRYVLTGDEAKAIDRYTIEKIGIPSVVLMERAALAVANALMKEEGPEEEIIIAAGCGNNGADALAVARILHQRGYGHLDIVYAGNREKATAEWKMQYKILQNIGLYPHPYEPGCLHSSEAAVDGLFGIGLAREVGGIYAELITELNYSARRIYAVDISSGICADTGAIMGVCVNAYRTITFGCEKLGSLFYPGAEYSGMVETADIGFPECAVTAVKPKQVRFGKEDLSQLPVRPAYSNKGTFGKVLVAAGGKNMAGAAYLCASAAYSVGAGLVRILTVEENRTILQTLLPEAVLTTIEEEKLEQQVAECVNWADAVAAGPGLGTGDLSEKLVDLILHTCEKPLVLDADGLNLLAKHPQWKKQLPAQTILTPHLGEMSRLMQEPVPVLQNQLLEKARELADMYNAVAVCKDARTIVAGKDELSYINVSGNQAMAKGGSGDVLTGVITGLLTGKLTPDQAARLGVYLHGLSGDTACRKKGSYSLFASDLAACLPEVLKAGTDNCQSGCPDA